MDMLKLCVCKNEIKVQKLRKGESYMFFVYRKLSRLDDPIVLALAGKNG